MKLTKVPFSQIFARDAGKDKNHLAELAKRLDTDAVGTLLEMHPIVVRETGKGTYRVVSGEAQFRLARGVLPEREKIGVALLEPEEEELFFLVDALIAPLVLGQAVKDIQEKAERALKERNVSRLGRNLSTRAHWRQLLGSAPWAGIRRRNVGTNGKASQESGGAMSGSGAGQEMPAAHDSGQSTNS